MVSNKNPIQWVLASGSKHRQKQLSQAGCKFMVTVSDVDESLIPNETAPGRAKRLAHAKAYSVAQQHPDALIIGSDQVAHLDGHILRKPGTHEAALKQLMQSSGRSVWFETALSVITPEQTINSCTRTEIEFWPFYEALANRYLLAETPYDAAGSFYSEAIGQWLIKHHRSDDPSAIIGLPMLALGRALRQLGQLPI